MSDPSTWKPDKAALKPPIYLSLVQQLEQDIRSGKLPPHTKLPAQRELAEYLQVNLSTITRVFKLCEKKGLIYAAVGRGTFVSPDAGLPYPSFQSDGETIAMDELRPYYQCNPLILENAAGILNHRDAARLFQLRHPAASLSHRAAAQKWLSWFHIQAMPEHILLASGAKSALALSFLSLFSPGDAIAADRYTFPPLLRLAEGMRIRLVPVEGDAQGMLPDALARQFGLAGIKGVYLSPSCQNPTAGSISAVRRKELALAAEKYNLLILEDDPYAFLADGGALPLVSIIPEQTVHIHSVSKSLAPLGVAYVIAPPHLRQRLKAAADALPPPSLLHAEIVSGLINNGTALRMFSQKRKLAAERNLLSRRFFPLRPGENPYSMFRFLPIPPDFDGYRFEMLAKSKGVRVLCAERFAVDSARRHAIRAAICSPATLEELEHGLTILQSLLRPVH